MQETFPVPDVNCGHCKAAIEGALGSLGGVESSSVDLDGKLVSVSYDEKVVDRADVIRAIESAGYPVAV